MNEKISKLKLRTCDLVIWRTINLGDLLGEKFLSMPGVHCGIVMVGSKYESLSLEPSPSGIYVSMFVDKIHSIEYLISKVWNSNQGSAFYILSRTEGPHIKSKKIIKLYQKIQELGKYGLVNRVGYCINAYLMINSSSTESTDDQRVDDSSALGLAESDYRYRICSEFVAQILKGVGILTQEAKIEHILPVDLYYLEFDSNYAYQKITIFNKKLHHSDSVINRILSN